MPTYEYRCSDCGTLYEVVQHIDDEPLTVCEKCGGKLRKVFHPAGIVFKGSGFYATDSRSKAKAGSNQSADRKAEKAEKSEGSDKKESKSAEKKSESSDKKADSSSSGKKPAAS
jgi:putative FmdB family regulatory protein